MEYANGEYEVTSLGYAVSEGFEELMATVDLSLELEPFLQWMPDDEFDLDIAYLDDADLFVSKPGEPHGVLNRHIGRLQTMDEGYFLLPFTGLHATEAAYERIIHHNAQCELVVTLNILDCFQNNPQYAELIEEKEATGRLRIYKAASDLPLPVGIADEYVNIVAADGDSPKAYLERDREEVYQWAKDKFESQKTEAEPVKPTASAGHTGRPEIAD